MSTESIITVGATGSKSNEGVIQWVIPYYVSDISQVLTIGVGDYENCQEVSRTWSCNNDGAGPSYIVTVTYEGGEVTSNSATGDGGAGTVWSLDYEVSEVPINAHWNWDVIKKTYGAYEEEGSWLFPESMPSEGGGSKSSGLGGSKAVGSGEKNPMYGKNTYIVMLPIVSVSYTKKTLPARVINGIGKMLSTIPEAPQAISSLDKGSRNWIQMPPQVSKRGNTWSITESWKLSENDPWPKAVYGDDGPN
jgi:hypothetical protein